jgi:uncharacterized protein YndB with AHSA1/START domain
VWRAWTDREILDQWWAPKPWKAETKTMDFREGGHWLYCMEGPEGEPHWYRVDYETITPGEFFTCLDAFCDEQGAISKEMPRMHWRVAFEGKGASTTGRLFRELSEGGEVTMPLQDMFWGACFSSFRDKYGINWMLNCQQK